MFITDFLLLKPYYYNYYKYYYDSKKNINNNYSNIVIIINNLQKTNVRSEIRPRVAIYTVVSLVCSFLDLLKLGRSGELGEPDNAKKRSEKIRTENTTNRHENVTETQRGEAVANGHLSCRQ